LTKFISEALHDPEFTTDLEHFVSRVCEAASINSLAQTLIKLTAPGVPDIYQGCEIWDFSLVDPDNRHSVDFVLRQDLLEVASTLSADKVWERRNEGLPKLWLIQKTLKLRARFSDFPDFNYEPLFLRGMKEDHAVAFLRGGKVITLVPRFVIKLNNDWQDTVMELPPGIWRNEFTGETFNGEMRMDNFFQKFPVALLVRKENH
jgi:(1->4)-alpha-D-glucan 1-alpha-D-glucosylmutase